MSTPVRWILAVLLILFGLAAAAVTVFGGAFSTVACRQVPPDWVYFFLVFVGLFCLAAAIMPAVMLVRRAAGKWLALVLGLGFVFSCGLYAAYLALLGNYC